MAAGTGCSLGSFGREKEENRSQGSLGSREEFSRGGETWGCLKAEREGHLENAGDESREWGQWAGCAEGTERGKWTSAQLLSVPGWSPSTQIAHTPSSYAGAVGNEL